MTHSCFFWGLISNLNVPGRWFASGRHMPSRWCLRYYSRSMRKTILWGPTAMTVWTLNTSSHRHYAAHHRKPTGHSHCYDVLSVTPRATQSQIKSAYYRLSKQYHPDINKSMGASFKFAEISEAYEVLGNIQKRKLYDRGLLNPTDLRSGQGTSQEADDYPDSFKSGEGMHSHRQRRPPPHGHTKAYNFDEFYKQHYGDNKAQRDFEREYNLKQEEEKQTQKSHAVRSIFVVGIFLGFLFSIWPFRSQPQNKKKSDF